MMRIQTKDTVVVISGKDKGKRGAVIALCRASNRVKVQGVGLVTKHMRARKQGEVSQLKRIESWLDLSKVMLFDASAGRPCRVRFVRTEDGAKKRVSVVSGNTI